MAVAEAPESVAAPQRVDLVVAKVGKPPAVVKHGSSFGLGAVVSNRGRDAAQPSVLRLYLSKDRTRGAGDILGASVAVKRVPARKTKTVSQRVKVPWGARGTYWVIACADATKKVRETKESNNCKSSSSQLKVDSDLHAQLSGRLQFVDEGQVVDAGKTETWHRTAQADVTIAVDGDPEGTTTFAGSGSSWVRDGSRTVRDVSESCIRTRNYQENGSGKLRYVGDGADDEIFGNFTRTDMSGVRIGLIMRADWSETRDQVGQGEFPCDPSTATSQGTTIDVSSIELKEVGLTTNTITYEVVGWEGAYGTTSPWDSVDGQLVLRLR
ncbi:CARDB domain-containing protein [Nocardioides hankookensis]|uniref:CARDB domain-containing protein n=1 Tax=Nocardioides hankookensis TaxID=443157 RepID=A0ABW1LFI4_9ACTN